MSRVPEGGVSFSLSHSLGPYDTSHVSTCAGALSPVSLPAAAWLLAGAIGGPGAIRRARGKVA